MKKLIYGALLVALGMPAFQSCIDDKESASVTAVRDAKAAELNAIADYWKAKSTQEGAASAAQNAMYAQQEAYYKAQAAAQQAQADRDSLENEMRKAAWDDELEAKKAEYEAAVKEAEERANAAQANAQEAWNRLNDAIKEAERRTWDYQTWLLNSQIAYLEAYQKYLDAVQKGEQDEITRAQGMVNFWMDKYNTASLKYAQCQEEIQNLQLRLLQANNGYGNAYDTYLSTLNGLEMDLAEANAQVEAYEAEIETYKEYANYTTEELDQAIKDATVVKNQTALALKEAKANEQDASEAQDAAYEYLTGSIYTKQGVEALLDEYQILYYVPEDQLEPGIFKNTEVKDNVLTTTYYFRQPNAKTAKEPWTAVTIFTTTQTTSEVVLGEVTPGIAPAPENVLTYGQYTAYNQLNEAGLNAFIEYLEDLNDEALEEKQEDDKDFEWSEADPAPYNVEIAEDALAVLKKEATNNTNFMKAYNEAVKAYYASVVITFDAQNAYDLASDKLTDLNNIKNDPASAEYIIAQLEQKIEDLNDPDVQGSIPALEAAIASYKQSYSENSLRDENNIKMLELCLSIEQQKLEGYQALLEAAQAGLDAAVKAFEAAE